MLQGQWVQQQKRLSVTGGITFEELEENFYVQANALIEAGSDLLLLETSQDMLNVKAGTIAVLTVHLKS